jgi:hypothetical protein
MMEGQDRQHMSLANPGNWWNSNKKRNGRGFYLKKASPATEFRVSLRREKLVAYSSIPRRERRRGVAFFLHSGQGEIMLSVLAAGAVAPVGTTQS